MFDDASSCGTVKDFKSQELRDELPCNASDLPDNASVMFDAIAEQPTCLKDFKSQNANASELPGNASVLLDAIAEQPTCLKDFKSQNAAIS
eukprot:11864790-Karenia_brevis.AAC.1